MQVVLLAMQYPIGRHQLLYLLELPQLEESQPEPEPQPLEQSLIYLPQ